MEPEVKEISRLSQPAYEQLVKQVPATGCPKTDLEAGFMCGVQHVLAKLREGFVTG